MALKSEAAGRLAGRGPVLSVAAPETVRTVAVLPDGIRSFRFSQIAVLSNDRSAPVYDRLLADAGAAADGVPAALSASSDASGVVSRARESELPFRDSDCLEAAGPFSRKERGIECMKSVM